MEYFKAPMKDTFVAVTEELLIRFLSGDVCVTNVCNVNAVMEFYLVWVI